jgi:hypothetical protein
MGGDPGGLNGGTLEHGGLAAQADQLEILGGSSGALFPLKAGLSRPVNNGFQRHGPPGAQSLLR